MRALRGFLAWERFLTTLPFFFLSMGAAEACFLALALDMEKTTVMSEAVRTGAAARWTAGWLRTGSWMRLVSEPVEGLEGC